MRFLCTGDWHIRPTRPRSRQDDYLEAMNSKLEQVFRIAEEHKCAAIGQPGDFFDSPNPPLWLLAHCLDLFRNRSVPLYAVFGQHDQRYHTMRVENTMLHLLGMMGGVHVLEQSGGPVELGRGVYLYGASWSEDVPEPQDPEAVNILLTHRMVVGEEKVWEAQEGHSWAQIMLRRNPAYNLIVTGDNHTRFTANLKGRALVNCGSLMRSNADQMEHRPAVYVYDTAKGTLEEVELDVAPADEVFAVQQVAKREQERERGEELEAFIRSVSGKEEHLDLDFIGVLRSLCADQEDGVASEVWNIVEESGYGQGK